MVRRVSEDDVREHLAELLKSVSDTREPFVVERDGHPLAVVISPEQFALVEQKIEDAWSVIDALQERNAGADPEEILREVTSVVEAVRQERYERRQTASRGY
jgi:prevent-host-death family protein